MLQNLPRRVLKQFTKKLNGGYSLVLIDGVENFTGEDFIYDMQEL